MAHNQKRRGARRLGFVERRNQRDGWYRVWTVGPWSRDSRRDTWRQWHWMPSRIEVIEYLVINAIFVGSVVFAVIAYLYYR